MSTVRTSLNNLGVQPSKGMTSSNPLYTGIGIPSFPTVATLPLARNSKVGDFAYVIQTALYYSFDGAAWQVFNAGGNGFPLAANGNANGHKIIGSAVATVAGDLVEYNQFTAATQRYYGGVYINAPTGQNVPNVEPYEKLIGDNNAFRPLVSNGFIYTNNNTTITVDNNIVNFPASVSLSIGGITMRNDEQPQGTIIATDFEVRQNGDVIISDIAQAVVFTNDIIGGTTLASQATLVPINTGDVFEIFVGGGNLPYQLGAHYLSLAFSSA